MEIPNWIDISSLAQIIHSCMVYLPTKLGHLWGIYVGKYIPYMDHLGRDPVVPS